MESAGEFALPHSVCGRGAGPAHRALGACCRRGRVTHTAGRAAKAGMGRSLSALSALICSPACNLPEFKERSAACLCQERGRGSFM